MTGRGCARDDPGISDFRASGAPNAASTRFIDTSAATVNDRCWRWPSHRSMLSEAMNERASGAVAVEADQASALEVWLRHRPRGSRIGLRQNPDGLTMTIPREAMAQGYLLLFCILWGVSAVGTTIFCASWALIPSSVTGDLWPLFVVCPLFWLIEIAMIVITVRMGRRCAFIDVVDDVLLINNKGLLGIRSHRWDRREIAAITVGRSHVVVNHETQPVLKVRRRGDFLTSGMFVGLNSRELEWIAWILRHALELQ